MISIAVSIVDGRQSEDGRWKATSSDNRTIYAEDFSKGAQGWHSYEMGPRNAGLGCIVALTRGGCLVPALSENGYIESSAPWWINPDHKDTGAGYLCLPFVLWLDSYYGGLPQKTLDLTDAQVDLKIVFTDFSSQNVHLYFWFQTYDYLVGKYVNYALTRQPIDLMTTPNMWTNIRFKLKASADEWTCLGTSAERSDRYGCGSLEHALRNVNADLGFIILPVRLDDPPSGNIRISKIVISK